MSMPYHDDGARTATFLRMALPIVSPLTWGAVLFLVYLRVSEFTRPAVLRVAGAFCFFLAYWAAVRSTHGLVESRDPVRLSRVAFGAKAPASRDVQPGLPHEFDRLCRQVEVSLLSRDYLIHTLEAGKAPPEALAEARALKPDRRGRLTAQQVERVLAKMEELM